MAENSKIEWTDHTFNGWLGCTKVSPACDHCYAERWARRVGRGLLWEGVRARTSLANWRQPVLWNKRAAEVGTRFRVFSASLADVFDNQVPMAWRSDLWRLIEETPYLDWLLLTKRIGNASSMLPWGPTSAWRNVWLGATVVTQAEVDRDLPKLLETPARIRFLSVEPMLEEIRIPPVFSKLHWVICGGESGPGARSMEVQWAAELRAQCNHRDVAFFMKQLSQADTSDYKDFESFPPSVRVREFPQ